MATAMTIERFLGQRHAPYNLVAHQRTGTSLQSARAAGILPQKVAKAVILKEDHRYVMVVLPTARRLRLNELRHKFGCSFDMATEQELRQIFSDCDHGAVPALGAAYGIDTIWDDSLRSAADVYFEAGDHEHLVHLRTRDYLQLMAEGMHGTFSEPLFLQ